MALSAVVLPAPLGPISPRMRPSSTRRSTPSKATVVPKAFRRPRASITGMASAFLLFALRLRVVVRVAVQQLFRFQPQPLDGGGDSRPLFHQELAALALQQQLARSVLDEHAQPPPLLHQFLID